MSVSKTVKERLQHKKTLSHKKKTILIALASGLLGAGVALSVAMPIMLQKHGSDTYLNSFEEVDSYLYKHRVDTRSTNYLEAFDQRSDFIKFAKKEFKEQFYINTALWTVIQEMSRSKEVAPMYNDVTSYAIVEPAASTFRIKLHVSNSNRFSLEAWLSTSSLERPTQYSNYNCSKINYGVWLVTRYNNSGGAGTEMELSDDNVYLMWKEWDESSRAINHNSTRFITFTLSGKTVDASTLYVISPYDFRNVNWSYSNALAPRLKDVFESNGYVYDADEYETFRSSIIAIQQGDLEMVEKFQEWLIATIFKKDEILKEYFNANNIPDDAVVFSGFPKALPPVESLPYSTTITISGNEPFFYGSKELTLHFDAR